MLITDKLKSRAKGQGFESKTSKNVFFAGDHPRN